MRRILWLSVVVGLGCSTHLDLERARELLRGAEEPTVPILVESPAAELPAPRGLRVVSGQLRAVPLKWDPLLMSDVAGYVIERAEEKEGPFHRFAALPGRLETSYVDRGNDLAPKQGSEGGRHDLGDGPTNVIGAAELEESITPIFGAVRGGRIAVDDRP